MPEVLTKMYQLLQLPRRESATTTPALGMYVSFDERSHELITLEVESFGRLRREASEVVDWLATSVVGGRGGGAMAKKGIFKERLLHISKYTVLWPLRLRSHVHRYKLAIPDRQEIKGRRERERGLMPMA